MTDPSQAVAAIPGRTEAAFVDAPPVPRSLESKQVLCRTLQLGVCGTDREILHSARPWTPPGEQYLILGHECLAVVEAVGSDVDPAQLKPDDLVVPQVRRARDRGSERPDLLPLDQFTERGIAYEHGFSPPQWVDRPEHLVAVPQNILEIAVFTEPLSVAEKGVNEALIVQRARLGEGWEAKPPRVLVTGMGPIGFAAVIACTCRQWPVTMLGRDDVDSPRVALAQKLQAAYVDQRLAAATALEAQYDLILECTGNDGVMLAAAQALGPCGAMVWLGSARVPEVRMHDVDSLMRRSLMLNQLHLGAVNAAPRDFHDAIAHLQQLWRDNRQAAAGLITRRTMNTDALLHFAKRERQSIKTAFCYE